MPGGGNVGADAGRGPKGAAMNLDEMIDMVIVQAGFQSGIPASVLLARGTVYPQARGPRMCDIPTNAHWSPEEEAYLRDQIGSMTDADIGAALGRSEAAIKIRRVRNGYPAASRRPGWLTGHGAAKALGSDIHNIMALTARGIIPHEIIPGVKGIIAIRQAWLYRWAINPENWIYFKFHKVRDGHLKRLIELKRERWEDAWWTTGQAAAWHGVDHQDIERAILKGRVAGVKWGNWWVKRSEVMREGLYFPKGKGAGTDLAWSEAGDAFMVLALAVGTGKKMLTEALGWSVSKRVDFRIETLWKTGRVPDLVEKYGLPVLIDEGRQLLFADWRDCPGRFPAIERAMGKFERWLDGEPNIFRLKFGPGANDPDLMRVRGVLAAWAAWYAVDADDLEMARKLRHACHARPVTLAGAYEAIRGWGVDPLGVARQGR